MNSAQVQVNWLIFINLVLSFQRKFSPQQKQLQQANLLCYRIHVWVDTWDFFFQLLLPDKSRFFASVTKKQNNALINGKQTSSPKSVTLIQTNLEALPPYVCASSLLPCSVIKSLDKLHAKIFWEQNKDKNYTPLIAWDTVCKQKSQGRLGLCKTLPLNKAYITKLGWKILTNTNNIWFKLIKEKNLKTDSFLICKPKLKHSLIWRKFYVNGTSSVIKAYPSIL